MRRRYTAQDFKDVVKRLREAYVEIVPKATISDLLRLHYEGYNVDGKKIYEVIKARFGQTTEAINQFNLRLSDKLLEKGWKGFLYSPGRYNEYELRMFDPADVLMLDARHMEDPAMKRMLARVTPQQRREMNFYLDQVNKFDSDLKTLASERKQLHFEAKSNLDQMQKYREMWKTDPARRDVYEKAYFDLNEKNVKIYKDVEKLDEHAASVRKEKDAWHAKFSELDAKSGAPARKRIERWEQTAPQAYEAETHLKSIYSDISIEDLKRVHPDIDSAVRVAAGDRQLTALYSKWYAFWEERGISSARADDLAQKASMKGLPVPKQKAIASHESWTQLSPAEKSEIFHAGELSDYIEATSPGAKDKAFERYLKKHAAPMVGTGKGKATMPPKPSTTLSQQKTDAKLNALVDELTGAPQVSGVAVNAYLKGKGIDPLTATVASHNQALGEIHAAADIIASQTMVTKAEAISLITTAPQKWNNILGAIAGNSYFTPFQQKIAAKAMIKL